MIARKMTESLSASAQVSFSARANASHLVAIREAWKATGVPVGVEDLLLIAVRDALIDFPSVNATADADGIKVYEEICVSVAIALDNGLVAPALPDLRGLSLEQIVTLRRDLVQRAREGKLSVPEMSFGTFTISNLGASRVEHFTPILNGGQMGILGIGRLTSAVFVDDNGQIGTRPELMLSLTTDHRVLDGAPSAQFFSSIIDRLEGSHPGLDHPRGVSA